MNETNNVELKAAIDKEKSSRIKWGFIWAALAALLWGSGYIPSVAVWKIPNLGDTSIFPEGTPGVLLAVVVISTGYGLTKFLTALLFWTAGEGKLSDVPRALKHWKISKVMLFATLLAAPLGVAGYQLAVGLVGGSFAAAASLLVGAFAGITASLLFKENLTRKALIGIAIIVIGGIIVFNPYALYEDLIRTKSILAVLGYIGGFMSAAMWGIEGAIVSRVSDYYDYAMSMACRGLFDILLWLILCVPLAMFYYGADVVFAAMVHIYSHPAFWIWEFLLAGGFFASYVGLYRSYPLIGAGRGTSVATLYIIPGFVSLYLFMGESIKWWVLVGAAISVIGTIYMYWESGESMTKGTRRDEEPVLEDASGIIKEGELRI